MTTMQPGFRSGPVEQRIGDQERDLAAECLREHMARGRLDAEEFDSRLETALTARVQSELDRLFLDLPAPHPAASTGPGSVDPGPVHSASVHSAFADAFTRPDDVWTADERAADVRTGAPAAGGHLGAETRGCGGPVAVPGAFLALMWAAAIVLTVVSGGHAWWVLWIPFGLSMGASKRNARRREFERRWHNNHLPYGPRR